jgi:hypothetical protein
LRSKQFFYVSSHLVIMVYLAKKAQLNNGLPTTYNLTLVEQID